MKSREKSLTLLLLLGALCVFTWLDLSLSMTLYHPNWLARVLEVLGEVPFLTLTMFAAMIWIDHGKKWQKVGAGILLVLLTLMALMLLGNYLSHSWPALAWYLAPVLVVGMLLTAWWLETKVPNQQKRVALAYAKTAVIYFFLVIMIMNVLKMTWGRMRFREMNEPATQFTAWYILTQRGAFQDAYASFPSGHAMNAAGTLLLTLLPGLIPQLKPYQKSLTVFVYVWTILVGVSRIVMGAHFATDVVMGILLSWGIFEGLCLIRRKRENETLHR